ncbi:MAG: ATP-binding protein [Burkholderiales bacterium]
MYDAVVSARTASAWVSHSYEVLREIGAVQEHLSRAESSQRGYLVTRSDSFLLERDQALTSLSTAVLHLESLISDDPMESERARVLDDLISSCIATMKQAQGKRATGRSMAQADPFLAAKQASSKIYSITEEMELEEIRLLAIRRSEEELRHARTLWLLIAAGLLAVLVLVPAYAGFIVQSRARKRLEQSLLDIAENSPGAVFRYRMDAHGTGRFEYLSASVEALFGLGRPAVLNDANSLWTVICAEDRPALSAALMQASATVTSLLHDFRVSTRGGEDRWLRASATARRDKDGAVVLTGRWTDVTEQRQLEHALQEAKGAAETASRAKSTFLAVMSHEIRTPMNGILGMLELLSLTKLDGAQRSTLSVVRESGKSLQRIVDDILDFSKIEAGKLEIAPAVASVRTVVETARNIYAGNASSKGLLLTCRYAPEIATAHVVDALRLGQILNNLVSNAIKFTASGSVELKAQRIDGSARHETLCFTVTDTGVGMSPDAQKQLFQPFVQVGAPATRGTGGTGLGLAICQRLVKLMHGTIEVQSALGNGTTVTVTLTLPLGDQQSLPQLPAAKTEAKALIEHRRLAPPVEQAEQEGTLVLAVDDHPTNRSLLGRQLNALGYAAEFARNGLEALEMWKSRRFSIVVTDCNMPDMDGYELARAIRMVENKDGVTRTPIIACTANAMSGAAEDCLAAGMDDYLSKPIELTELSKKMDQWLPLPGATNLIERYAEGAPTSSDDSPVNMHLIAAASGGELGAERDILLEFREANDQDVETLHRAVHDHNPERIAHAAHRMNGASRSIGADALAAVCKRIENAARTHDLETVKLSISGLQQQLARVNAFIDELCQGTAPVPATGS